MVNAKHPAIAPCQSTQNLRINALIDNNKYNVELKKVDKLTQHFEKIMI